MVDLDCDMLIAAIFFFLVRLLNMCKSGTAFNLLWAGLPGLAFYYSGLLCLVSWIGIMNAGWLCLMRSEISLHMIFIFFLDCTKKAAFYLGSPLHIIRSLFSQVHFFQNAILHNFNKAFETLSPFFSECSFHWLQHLFF